jgi:hypothetical protein
MYISQPWASGPVVLVGTSHGANQIIKASVHVREYIVTTIRFMQLWSYPGNPLHKSRAKMKAKGRKIQPFSSSSCKSNSLSVYWNLIDWFFCAI